jgi:SAM-dependent methyltransferase
MSDNLVRDVHDAVAGSASPAEASVRPPGTTPRQLEAMRRDVLRKLGLQRGTSVVEIGCGVALLGVPIARRAARYVGLDFAPHAVQVARDRLRTAGRHDRAQVLCIDVLTARREELQALGSFDRVLMYAVFHYARTEAEAVLFLQRTLGLLAPGGRALIGNVPLDDLQVDWTPSDAPPEGLIARLVALARWVIRPGTGTVPLTRRWKVRNVVETTLKRRSAGERFAPARLPPSYTLSLSTAAVEHWLATLDTDFVYRWELPAPGVPLAAGRADLIIVRR